MKNFFQLVFLSSIFLLFSCASAPPPNTTIYDGQWQGEFSCGKGVKRQVVVSIEKSRIKDYIVSLEDIPDDELFKIKEEYPKSYFIDDRHYRFDAKGFISINGGMNLSSYFTKNDRTLYLDLRGNFNGSGFDLSGTVSAGGPTSMYGKPCKALLVKSKIQSGLVMASNTSSLPSLAGANVNGFGRYHALIIGVDEYSGLPDLKSAIFDAKVISSLLRDEYGFEIKLLMNPTRNEIIRALSQYRKQLEHQDNLLIYYAGHGWLDKEADQGYWLPSDATRDDESNWFSNSTLTSSLRAMPAKHVMVISDSCYSGKLVRGLKMSQRNSHYLEQLINKKARTVMTSGGLEPVLDKGGKNDHSIFASALIDALRRNDGIMEGSVLFSQVRRPVAVNADQTPEYADIRKAGHDGGDFLFVKKAKQ